MRALPEVDDEVNMRNTRADRIGRIKRKRRRILQRLLRDVRAGLRGLFLVRTKPPVYVASGLTFQGVPILYGAE